MRRFLTALAAVLFIALPAVAQQSISGKIIRAGTAPLSALGQSGATTGQLPYWNGSAWAPVSFGGDLTGSPPSAALAAIGSASTQGILSRLSIDTKGRVTSLGPLASQSLFGNTTLGTSADIYYCSMASAAFTVTLPAASSAVRTYIITVATAGHNLTIAAAGSDTIAGAATMTLSTVYQSVILQNDAAASWYVLAQYPAPAGGSGTVTSVALSVPSWESVSGSPITGSGTFTVTDNSQSANTFFRGPTSGASATPTFGAIVGADLPNPSSSAKGGVQSIAAVSHQFVTSISTSGVPALAQPAAADVSGLAASATTDTTNGSNITSGTVSSARLPATTLYRYQAFVFGNGGSVLTTGLVNADCAITGAATLVAVYLSSADNTSGSATVDILRHNAGVPVSADSIVGGSGTKPSLSSATYAKDTTFTLWTSTTLAADDVISLNLTSVTSLKYLTVTLVWQVS